MKLLLTLLISLGCLQAQVGTFHAPVSATVTSSSSTTLTIQQPASGAKQVTFIAAIVQCPGQSFSVAQAYNGAGATTTAFLATPMMTTSPAQAHASLANAFSASNVGSGTTLSSLLTYTSGAIAVIDLTNPGASMTGNGITKNYSITLTNTGMSSCTATLDVIWSER